MIFLAKCLIFFLNIIFTASSVSAAGPSSDLPSARRNVTPKKSSKSFSHGPLSSGQLKVTASWQVVGSTGKKGAAMGTMAESYVAPGVIFQSSPQNWRLKIGSVEIPVSFASGEKDGESVLTAERGDLIKVFALEMSEEDRLTIAEGPEQTMSLLTEGVRLTVGRAPSRQMETIYRSPGEGLFLVKGSLTFAK